MRIAVSVLADDSVSRIGIAAQLRGQPRMHVIDEDTGSEPEMAVIAITALDDAGLAFIGSSRRQTAGPFVLVVGRLDEHDILVAGQLGAAALLARRDVTSARLVHALEVALRERAGTSDRHGCLTPHVDWLAHRRASPGLEPRGLHEREADVLRLLAEGFDTMEVAAKLAYSERTVKNVLHDITSRFHLRNRCHAVAFALRQGLI